MIAFRHEIAGRRLCGYGLVLECDDEGNSCEVTFHRDWFAKSEGGIVWEPWEQRLDPFDYFAQLTRVPRWETTNRGNSTV